MWCFILNSRKKLGNKTVLFIYFPIEKAACIISPIIFMVGDCPASSATGKKTHSSQTQERRLQHCEGIDLNFYRHLLRSFSILIKAKIVPNPPRFDKLVKVCFMCT